MSYLVLNGLRFPVDYPAEHYRGTDRKSPDYCEALPDDSEINQLFMWYIHEETGAVHDLAKARRYAELSNAYFPERRFEVIELVKTGTAGPNGDRQFLGFDISWHGITNSLIFENLLPGPDAVLAREPVPLLSDLIRRFFCPRLNQFGLFPTSDDASHCHRAMVALQAFRPNLYEGGDLEKEFEVVGIYLVPM